MIDVLFINPGDHRILYQQLANEQTAIEPPLWCRLLASYCEAKGKTTDIIDLVAFPIVLEEFHRISIRGEGRNPLCVIVAHGSQPSASTQLMSSVIEITRFFKSIRGGGWNVMVVGGHPAALPKWTLEQTQADFVCTGEGPVSILDALTLPRRDVRGVAYMDHGKIVINDPAPNVWDLSEMPGGQWEKLPMDQYRSHLWHAMTNGMVRKPYASIYTSLGCPMSCSFCCIQNPFREGDKLKFHGKTNSYRTQLADFVLGEIETLVEDYGVRNLKIADEMFLLKPSHVEAICDGIIERGYGDRLNIWSYGRVDCTQERFLEKYRRAGGRWIALGIEGVSNEVRDGVEKADYGPEDIVKTCERIRSHDIAILANFIFGLPSDNHDTIKQNRDLIWQIMPEFLNVYNIVAYPGTKLYEQAKAEGWALPKTWSAYSHHAYDYLPLPSRYLTATQLLRMREDVIRDYFTDPSYLAMIERKYGAEARRVVDENGRIKLKRKLLGD